MTAKSLDEFIDDWKNSAAAERANYMLFLSQLCDQLGVPQPQPTQADVTQNAYVFERDVKFDQGDGTSTTGRIDLYKRGCFVLEAKQGSDAKRAEEEAAETLAPKGAKASKKKGTAVRGTAAWDDAMIRARGQAEAYAKALPASEGWPPFLIVVDVGHSIELYSEFTRSGKAYVMFPDPQSFRIKLDDLRDEKIRARLAAVWTDPLSLDPSRRAAKVTRELAERLAALAKLLEKAGHEPGAVAKFLMRCLFTMFAEDVELIPKGSFGELLISLQETPENFQPMVEALWQTMNSGGFSPVLRKKILKFNGGLFAESSALPLDGPMLTLLIEAAKADWADVEPAIFGTLLERALDVRERHKLGAHYTPRAYVERLVMPTVIEPLRDEWKTAYAAAITHAQGGDLKAAQDEVRRFHDHLCATRVLDPACGSGNFLYVTLEHMKRLEGEVLHALREFGEKQQVLDIHEVDPHQFLGIELNPRAAAIADLVLWIGYLQWHFRTRGKAQPAEPIIRNYKNIECRDAVLAWDRTEPLLDEDGQPVTRWDGHTTKPHPVTGEEVPDETARVQELRYINPRKAGWPRAEYVVGNPPFLGKGEKMREALGDGYVAALRIAFKEVPGSCDFVLYWWSYAAELLSRGEIRQFGFITTNSIGQAFNRRIVAYHLEGKSPISIRFAIADHPWVDSSDGAAVRIAMTVARPGKQLGIVGLVVREIPQDDGSAVVELSTNVAIIHEDLSGGLDLAGATELVASKGIGCNGVMLASQGFVVAPSKADELSQSSPAAASIIKEYVKGRDLTRIPKNAFVIDTYGFSEVELRTRFPHIYQHLLKHVLPDRKGKRDAQFRDKWWLFGRSRPEFRRALTGLKRYISTVETSKHRVFVFLSDRVIPDHKTVNLAIDDPFALGVLSSRIHVLWALAQGSLLEDRPVYPRTRCFDTFPFPIAADPAIENVRQLAEQLDAHRKRQQAAHPKLTLTDMYNVLEKLRAGEALSAKERAIHDQGLVSVLRQIHDDLDAAVFAAYGWPADLSDEQILERLVALNAERAAEEARGLIRWLRPEFQAPQAGGAKQAELELADEPEAKPAKTPGRLKAGLQRKPAWPKEPALRTRLVQEALAAAAAPLEPEAIAKQFSRGNASQVTEILDALCSLGLARKSRGKYSRA